MSPAPRRFRFLTLAALFALAAAASGCGDVNVGKAESVAALAGAAGGPGFFDGSPADPVRFDSPSGVAVVGTNRFVADTENHVIRKTDAAGEVTTFAGSAGKAGSADAQGDAARFSSPDGIAAVGSVLYVADRGNHTVRRISSTRSVSTFVGRADAATTRNGDASAALLNAPAGITGTTGTLYFTDTNENVVRKILF